MPDQNPSSNDLLDLLKIAYRWRRFILGLTFVAAVASVLLSLFAMPNYYKSTVTFYPTNPTMTDRAMLYSEKAGENEIDYFGGNSDIDRILTLATMSGTVDYIINRYKLYEHYDYDTASRDGRYKTRLKFEKNYNTRKTALGAIEISVWDTDKALAAEIANHIAETVDNKNRDMINRDKRAVINLFSEQLKQKETLVSQLTNELKTLNNRAGNNAESIQVLTSRLESALEDLNATSRLYEQYSTSANLDVSTINITEPAFPAIRKDKPKRSIVVLSYTIGTFLLALIFAVFVDKYRELKPQLADA